MDIGMTTLLFTGIEINHEIMYYQFLYQQYDLISKLGKKQYKIGNFKL